MLSCLLEVDSLIDFLGAIHRARIGRHVPARGCIQVSITATSDAHRSTDFDILRVQPRPSSLLLLACLVRNECFVELREIGVLAGLILSGRVPRRLHQLVALDRAIGRIAVSKYRHESLGRDMTLPTLVDLALALFLRGCD